MISKWGRRSRADRLISVSERSVCAPGPRSSTRAGFGVSSASSSRARTARLARRRGLALRLVIYLGQAGDLKSDRTHYQLLNWAGGL